MTLDSGFVAGGGLFPVPYAASHKARGREASRHW